MRVVQFRPAPSNVMVPLSGVVPVLASAIIPSSYSDSHPLACPALRDRMVAAVQQSAPHSFTKSGSGSITEVTLSGSIVRGGIGAFGMSMGFSHADWREQMWAYVYRRATALGKIVHARVDTTSFEYALIFTKDGYGRAWNDEQYANASTTFWIRDAIKIGSIGLNSGGKTFVLGELTPERFRDYVGLHEYVEAEGGQHIDACRAELAAVRKSEGLFPEYAIWLHSLAMKRHRDPTVRGYFNRAVPDFTTQYNPRQFAPIAYVDMFYQIIASKLA